MLFSLTSTTPDATDLGYVLHKHPDRVRSVDVAFGTAHVFYPEATPQRCTATLLVEVDPVALARGKGQRNPRGLEPYVNDRPYAASSMLSVALRRVYGSAINGTCDTHPELVDRRLDLEVEIPVLPARGDDDLVDRLFEPLGYEVDATSIGLDDAFPGWGASPYVSLNLRGSQTVQAVLQHLYVLLPVLDAKKHYWVGDDEVDKLVRQAGAWLSGHPDVELITRRYLRFGDLANDALAQLSESVDDPDAIAVAQDDAEDAIERPLSLNDQRTAAVLGAVRAAGAGRVVDLGCGEGRLLARLADEPGVSELVGVDVSVGALERAERRLNLDEMSERRRETIRLLQGALTYVDTRIRGFDVATVIEVVEHLDPERVDVFTGVVFGDAAPTTVILTTPNREYNVRFEALGPNEMRHDDHRFEWTRAEFAAWTATVAGRYGYTCVLSGIGPDDPEVGTPTQMAVFTKAAPVAPSAATGAAQ